MNSYSSLSWSAVADHTTLPAQQKLSNKLNWNEPAIDVIDDFTARAPLHVNSWTELGRALELFANSGHRYACVLNSAGELTGILAARELQGRHAGQMANQLQVPYNEVPIHYLMVPVSSLPLVTRQQLERARIGDAVATLQKSGRDFLLVHNNGELHGVVSALGIAERTGESVHVYHHASSFVEIVHATRHTEEID